jgi:hypothetical protein
MGRPYGWYNTAMTLILFLLELLIPVTITAGLLYWVAGILPLASLNRTFTLGLLAFIFVLFSFIFSVVLDTLLLPFRKRSANHAFFNRVDPRSRLIRCILVGVVIPILVFSAAVLVKLPSQQTPITYLLQPRGSTSQVPRSVLISEAVLQATDPAIKLQGIKTLQTLPAIDAEEQLLRLVQVDPALLSNAIVSQALSKALASYGMAIKPELLTIFNQVDPAARKGGTSTGDDLFQRYFSAPFEALKKELTDQNPGADPALVDAAAAELQARIDKIQAGLSGTSDGDPKLRFVMDTFLGMDIKQDPDLLAFGKKIAADDTYPDGVRGQALLLIGKLGGPGELDGLYAYLQADNALLKSKALEAIAALQAKEPAPK